MKVGVLTGSMSRQAGGLFWSVRQLARSTQAAGCGVEVFAARDVDSARDRPQWVGVNLQVLEQRGPTAFGFVPELNRALETSDPGLLHTHGIWMYPSLAALQWSRRKRRPYLISPRGMLDPWAVRHARWKKRLAGWWYEHDHLLGAACIHALCEAEYRAIRSYGLRNSVAVIPNGVDLPDAAVGLPPWAPRLPADSRVLLFLGRLHPKKGLANLVRAWAALRQSARVQAERWHLVVAGWDQGEHRQALQSLTADLGIGDSTHFVGPQFGPDKAASLAHADAFVLPSVSEGLPMAVLEAWAYGLPVLMTPQCNLPEGFAAGAALSIEPEVASLEAGLMAFFSLDAEAQRAMGERGRQLVETRFSWPLIGAEMRAVYAWVLGQGPKPECVIDD